jgi:hypothetical protein
MMGVLDCLKAIVFALLYVQCLGDEHDGCRNQPALALSRWIELLNPWS